MRNLRIRLLPAVSDEEALLWPRMQDSGERQMSGDDHIHSTPLHSVSLAAPSQVQPPAHFDMMPECAHRLDVGRYGKVGIVTGQYRGQPTSLFIDVPVSHALQLLIDRFQGRPPLLVLCSAPELEAAPVPLEPTDVGEAEEVERFRPPLSTCFSLFGDESAELDQPRFLRMQA